MHHWTTHSRPLNIIKKFCTRWCANLFMECFVRKCDEWRCIIAFSIAWLGVWRYRFSTTTYFLMNNAHLRTNIFLEKSLNSVKKIKNLSLRPVHTSARRAQLQACPAYVGVSNFFWGGDQLPIPTRYKMSVGGTSPPPHVKFLAWGDQPPPRPHVVPGERLRLDREHSSRGW